MAEHFYISHKIEVLSRLFAQNQQRKSDIFQKDSIITQTKGINMWLASELATKNKIFANFSFISPQNFINDLYRICELRTNSNYSTTKHTWEIYDLLNKDEFIEEFSFVANYFHDNDVKRLQLATKTADLFDQYMVYRSDYIKLWNQQLHPEIKEETLTDNFHKHEAWQYWLWNKIKKLDINDNPDQVELASKLISKLESGQYTEKIKTSFQSVNFFGISILAEFHINIFKALAKVCDVNHYMLSPSPNTEWWNYEVHGKNDMLSNCKLTGQHTFASLMNKSAASAKNDNSSDEATNLLTCMQADLINDENKHIKNFSFNEQNDNSLQISCSYSPVREVEALYNYLLDCLDKNNTLTPKDISVQLSDIKLYSPYIKAVFDNGPVKIPYIICDAAYTDGDTLSSALAAFFKLPIENFSSESVMRLLESKHIQKKFDIEDLDLIRSLLADANIRLGLEGRKEDDTYLQSWNHGISKLVLGYAIKGGPNYNYEGENYYLSDNAEEGKADYIFRLSRFIKTLSYLSNETHKEKTLKEWKEFLLTKLIPKLFEHSDDLSEESEYIQQQISSLSFYSNNTEKIPFTVIKQAVLDGLQKDTRNSNYISGRLTFSSMLSVKNIPFKVIAILGLNNDVFPRQQQQNGFDLMSFEQRNGDRNIRENDKYLFLETLLAVREQLYLSYIGLSAKDNSESPPSLLIEELLEYFSLGTAPILENIQVKHPLHGFSNRYLGNNPRLFTYFNYKANETITEHHNSIAVIDHQKVILFDDLVRFLKEPVKWFYNKTLGIYYGNDDKSLPENELFESGKLDQWQLKHDLLGLDEIDESEYISRNKSKGKLSFGNMAKIELEGQKGNIEGLKTRFTNKTKGLEKHSKEFELPLGEYTLRGKINQLYGPFHIYTHVSGENSNAKYMQEAHLKHLVLSACDDAHMTDFMSVKKNYTIAKASINQATAKEIMKELCAWMDLGNKEAIYYSPRAAYDLKERGLNAAFNGLVYDAKYDAYLQKEQEKGLLGNLESINTDGLERISELVFGSITIESNI